MRKLLYAGAWFASTTRCYYPSQRTFGLLGGGFILAYHDLPAADFERQIEALKPNEPVHLAELFQRDRSGKDTAGLFSITVDDGVASTVRGISEVCRRRHWPVTFYLPTGYLDGEVALPFQLWRKATAYLPLETLDLPSQRLDLSTRSKFSKFVHDFQMTMFTQPQSSFTPLIEELRSWILNRKLATEDQLRPPDPISWSEVTDLSEHDEISFQSHGVSHTAVSALSAEALKSELEDSKQSISERTNRECRHFCYPFGERESIGSMAPAIVATIYDTAVTMARGRIRGHAWYTMPRIQIYERDQPDMVRLKILTL